MSFATSPIRGRHAANDLAPGGVVWSAARAMDRRCVAHPEAAPVIMAV
jgi:hypothetical protein